MPESLQLMFAPPLAIARVGGSGVPLESFTWIEDPTIYGAGKTVISPAVSLEVLGDNSVRPYKPGHIQFRDGRLLRPVCPFFELGFLNKRGKWQPLDLDTLKKLRLSPGDIEFRIVAANRKAARRTGDESCAFQAEVQIMGDDHRKHPLLASSPSINGLVRGDRPITLGYLQVIKPVRGELLGVNRSVIRLRFTPGAGSVYGGPSASTGLDLVSGRTYPIVPPENRILNEEAPWFKWNSSVGGVPQPADTFDADDTRGTSDSWGIVDDTCDAILTATLRKNNETLIARARVISGPPDYAPDRRPVVSMADELADREPRAIGVANIAGASLNQLQQAVADLFRRAAETACLTNVEFTRLAAIRINQSELAGQVSGKPKQKRSPADGQPEVVGVANDRPKVDDRSMTLQDRPFASEDCDFPPRPATPEDLSRQQHARKKHFESLSAIEEVITLILRSKGDRLKKVVRPPHMRFFETRQSGEVRDIRNQSDRLHDMRMPPYMRDSDYYPLSLTNRQYDILMAYCERLLADEKAAAAKDKKKQQDRAEVAVPYKASDTKKYHLPQSSPAQQHVDNVQKRQANRPSSN